MPSECPLFDLAPSSYVPLYQQLIDQVCALIASGHFQPGDRLPSVRQVARLTAVNPMTVSKAYARLEADGVLQRIRGQAMRVLKSTSKATFPQRQEQFRRLIRPAIHQAKQLGLNDDQLIKIVLSVVQEQSMPLKGLAASQTGL
jgi:GntR family transcriptional regulator